MATFYIVPPRSLLGERFAQQLQSMLPRFPATPASWNKLADAVVETLASAPNAFVVAQEELPCNEDMVQALRDGFGAEPDDEVIEVRASEDRLTTRQCVVV
jgi:hypothetical protein